MKNKKIKVMYLNIAIIIIFILIYFVLLYLNKDNLFAIILILLGFFLVILSIIILVNIYKNIMINSNFYILKINKNGDIKFKNKLFIQGLDNDYKNIKEFNIVCEENCSLILKNSYTFKVIFEIEKDTNKLIKFSIRKILGKLYIFGTEENENVIINNIESRNKLSNLYDFDTYKKHIIARQNIKDKWYISLLKISNYEDLIKIFGLNYYEKLLLKYINIINNLIKNKNINLYHIDHNIIGIIFNNNLFIETKNILDNIYINTSIIEIDNYKINIHNKIGLLEVDNFNYLDISQKLDFALKKACESKDDIIIYNDEISKSILKVFNIENDIRKGLEKDEFVLYYQPQYDIINNKIIGVEALLRWDNDSYRNISPYEYLLIAERANLIQDLGNLILEKALIISKDLKKYHINVSINLTPTQLLDKNFLNYILKLINKHDINPNNITLEITENTLIESFYTINQELKILKGKGFKIALDDFGTGYSSLKYLKELEFDYIKTDRDFIKDITNNENNKMILKFIITLSKELNKDLIIEGVETKEELNYVINNKGKYIQGYYFSKPIPYYELKELIEKENYESRK